MSLSVSDGIRQISNNLQKCRKYFFKSICQMCRNNLINEFACPKCKICFYCSNECWKKDIDHQKLCLTIRELAVTRGGHLYKGIEKMTADEYRMMRVLTLTACQNALSRQLKPFEQEILLFPKICFICKTTKNLQTCKYCKEESYCKEHENDFKQSNHKIWCAMYTLFIDLNIFQENHGQIEIKLNPNMIKYNDDNEKKIPATIDKIFNYLKIDSNNKLEYTMLTQLASGPLTCWYTLKFSNKINVTNITIHLIGAEPEFELQSLHLKWELFFMHLLPKLKTLNLHFVGPELIIDRKEMLNFQHKQKLCDTCRKQKKIINYHFINQLYHDYCKEIDYQNPDLICFFNPGLHRVTGYNTEDTWPLTIEEVSNKNCPIVITQYTKYESPKDLQRFFSHTRRMVKIAMPPTCNPFRSKKPERNFISDDHAPFIFKNFYFFILE